MTALARRTLLHFFENIVVNVRNLFLVNSYTLPLTYQFDLRQAKEVWDFSHNCHSDPAAFRGIATDPYLLRFIGGRPRTSLRSNPM